MNGKQTQPDDIDLFAPADVPIAQYNRETLHPVGLHMCPDCLQTFERTSVYFHVTGASRFAGKPRYTNRCIPCQNAHKNAWYAATTERDPAFTEHRTELSRQYRAKLTEEQKASILKRRRATYDDENERRRRDPFDVTTVNAIDLRSLSNADLLWANRSLEQIGQRVCVKCRCLKPLNRRTFRRVTARGRTRYRRACKQCMSKRGQSKNGTGGHTNE